jgi:hypothetical protein
LTVVLVAVTALVYDFAARQARGDEAEPLDQSREQLYAEGRWLMDAADARRGQELHLSPAPEIRSLRNGTMPDFLQSIQRGLGGPLVDRFDSLAPPTPAPTPWWKQFEGSLQTANPAEASRRAPAAVAAPQGAWLNWSVSPPDDRVVAATAEATDRVEAPRPVAALRSTAVELESKANHLEELELYEQADALRALSQRMREDARRLTVSGPRTGFAWGATASEYDAESDSQAFGRSELRGAPTERPRRGKLFAREPRRAVGDPTVSVDNPYGSDPEDSSVERSVLVEPPSE